MVRLERKKHKLNPKNSQTRLLPLQLGAGTRCMSVWTNNNLQRSTDTQSPLQKEELSAELLGMLSQRQMEALQPHANTQYSGKTSSR